jgi:hypothetical protein
MKLFKKVAETTGSVVKTTAAATVNVAKTVGEKGVAVVKTTGEVAGKAGHAVANTMGMALSPLSEQEVSRRVVIALGCEEGFLHFLCARLLAIWGKSAMCQSLLPLLLVMLSRKLVLITVV